MCGCYYISDEITAEIERLVWQADEKLHEPTASALNQIGSAQIHPGDEAPILLAGDGGIACAWRRWGFPLPQGQKKGLVFNARCESAAEKPFFSQGLRHRRAVIPAAAFYEWDRTKTKYTFRKEDQKALFMAGCCRYYGDGEHFVILTTGANSSMEPVHDRMPLLLEGDEVASWILDGRKTEEILRKVPFLLERSAEYEQMRFF